MVQHERQHSLSTGIEVARALVVLAAFGAAASISSSAYAQSFNQTFEAATCNVPTATYPTIQSAVNVINCSEIVLSAGSFFESVTIGRNLELQGAGSQSTIIIGKVIVSGFGSTVRLEGLKIFALAGTLPFGGLVAWDGTVVMPDDLLIGIINPLFADGFEPGDLSNWSSVVP